MNGIINRMGQCGDNRGINLGGNVYCSFAVAFTYTHSHLPLIRKRTINIYKTNNPVIHILLNYHEVSKC